MREGFLILYTYSTRAIRNHLEVPYIQSRLELLIQKIIQTHYGIPSFPSVSPIYMLKIHSLHSTNRLQRIFSQPLILATIATASLISGTFGFNSSVVAQNLNVNNTEVTNYAKAVLGMEPARQEAFGEIKKLIGSKDIPQVICNDSTSFNALPGKAKDIAVNYCNHSQKIVEDSGLTVERFNKITLEIQNNNNLKRQLYNTLLRLQKASPSKTSK